VQTIVALAAVAWFIGAAILVGDGSVGLAGDPPNQEVIGDAAVMAVHKVGRAILVGLGILSLAQVDYDVLAAWLRPGNAPAEGEGR
jgi:hypothetical protein